MIDPQRFAKALTGIIGLYPDFTEDADQPADYHREPDLYLSDAHPLLRPDVINSLGTYVGGIYAPDYSATKNYKPWDLVKKGDSYFEALVKGANNDTDDPLKWQVTTPLSAWFGRLERGAIARLGMELSSNPPSSQPLDRQQVFAREGNIGGILYKQGRFLGCRFTLKKRDVALLLARIGLQLTGAVTNLPIYLFHSSSPEPIKVFRLTGNNPNRTIYVDANTYLYENIGGYYELGYYESDLPLDINVIGAERGFNVSGCSSCGGNDVTLAQSRSEIVEIQSNFVEGVLTSGVMDWPTETDVKFQSWGFNLILEARCDVTDLLLANSDVLKNMVFSMVSCDVLEALRTTTRTNADVATLKSMANVVLYGNSSTKSDNGLAAKRDKMLSDLKLVAYKLSPACMQVAAPTIDGPEWGSLFDTIRY